MSGVPRAHGDEPVGKILQIDYEGAFPVGMGNAGLLQIAVPNTHKTYRVLLKAYTLSGQVLFRMQHHYSRNVILISNPDLVADSWSAF
jgi:hypothetical protein